MRVQLNRQKNKENKEMFGNALTILLWVLHDKFGFGNKRLERLIDEIDKFNEDFNAGLIDPKELIEQLEEETKIKIKYEGVWLMKFSELTKPELDEIIENANFTEEELRIFKLLVGNMSLEQVSQRLMLSKATISRRIKDMKIKIERADNMVKTIPIWEKVALTIEEASEYSNIGINRISNMLNEISCPFVLKVGNKRLVKRKEFEKYIEKSREI